MRNRVTFEVNADGEAALAKIQEATGTLSKSDVIRDAISLYEILVEKAQEQKVVFVGDSRETAAELLMPPLERAAKNARASGSAVKVSPRAS